MYFQPRAARPVCDRPNGGLSVIWAACRLAAFSYRPTRGVKRTSNSSYLLGIGIIGRLERSIRGTLSVLRGFGGWVFRVLHSSCFQGCRIRRILPALSRGIFASGLRDGSRLILYILGRPRRIRGVGRFGCVLRG